jgi:SAM-dependent methyltransferase
VIDFGCGIGRFEDLLNKFFDNYIGVDIVRKIPKTRIFYTVEDFWKVSLRADAIFTSVVIQHITDDKYVAKLVKRFSEILPIGGCVYMNEQVGDGEIVYRGDFPYINRRTRKTYLKLFKPQGFELEREIPRRHHRILKFRKVK